MKIVTLVENTSRRPGLTAGWGLSLYVETGARKVLFDMGPDASFLDNAAALGVDIAAVDLAVLSHGHYDHGGGLPAFCKRNDQADIYLRRGALGAYYAVPPEEKPHYIGLPRLVATLSRRFVFTEELVKLEGGLTLFSCVEDDRSVRAVAPKLQEKTPEGFRPDGFAHEQHLLVEEDGKAALLIGCGHTGVVNILRAAERRLGRRPDVVFGGFHLFELDPDAPASERLIAVTAEELGKGNTVYYTGHCTGDWAYEQLQETLGDRLRPMDCGASAEL